MNVAEARAVRHTNVSAKKHAIGSKAVSAQNEALGRLEDLMLHAGVGRVSYAGVPVQPVEKARQAT